MSKQILFSEQHLAESKLIIDQIDRVAIEKMTILLA